MTDPYEVLGVSRDATLDEIKKAYRRLAKAYHPDLHPNDLAAEIKMKQINQAYGLIMDLENSAAKWAHQQCSQQDDQQGDQQDDQQSDQQDEQQGDQQDEQQGDQQDDQQGDQQDDQQGDQQDSQQDEQHHSQSNSHSFSGNASTCGRNKASSRVGKRNFWITTIIAAVLIVGSIVMLFYPGLYGRGTLGITLALLHSVIGIAGTIGYNYCFAGNGHAYTWYKAVLSVLCAVGSMVGVVVALMVGVVALTVGVCAAIAVGSVAIIIGISVAVVKLIFSLFA